MPKQYNMCVEIDFVPQWCNGNMRLICDLNDENVFAWTSPAPCGPQTVIAQCRADICKPLRLRLASHGKVQNNDTKLVDGIIVQDKCVKITRLTLDEINITHALFLHEFVTETGVTTPGSLYFGQNGSMDFVIEPNIFVWLQNCELALDQNES